MDSTDLMRCRPREITDLDIGVLNFIIDFISKNGFAPTVREIQAGTDAASTSAVNYSLKKWETAGMISLVAKKSRSIVVAGSILFIPEIPPITKGMPLPNVKRKADWLKDQSEVLQTYLKEQNYD